MKFSELAPRERHNFVYFLLFFFFTISLCRPTSRFFPVWLADVNHLTKTETGIVFSSISLFAIIFQPVFGLMSDKLGLRKHLLWTITVLLILFAPFFIFRFLPAAADEYYRWFAGRRDLPWDCFLQRLRGGGSLYRTRQPGQPL
ncbi:MFS transporter [Klebsiella pneumoniae subsp. pneumoniae]|nr:MFS transporter [Klebsiella pneumoniae subsp. pneumoniae]